MCRIKIKEWATVASGAMNLKNMKEWLNTNIRASDVAVILTLVLNIANKVTSAR